MSRKDVFHKSDISEDALARQIRDALRRKAESLPAASSGAEQAIYQIHRIIEEERKMKKWSAKKVIIATAAVCVLGCITAVAAGKVTSTMGSSSHEEEIRDYGQLDNMVKKLGFDAKTPESFGNGYHFANAVPTHDKAMDADGNVVKTADNLSVMYEKEGAPFISMSAQGTRMYDGEEEKSDQTFEYNGISLGYSSDHYRFVPPDYEISPEEQAKVDAGEMYISYGSSEIEDKITKSIRWEDGGIIYLLLSFDNSMSPEDFFQMACEVIDMK